MWTVYIAPKGTYEYKVFGSYETEDKAERMCEMWGWSYDDGHRSYWMSYKEDK